MPIGQTTLTCTSSMTFSDFLFFSLYSLPQNLIFSTMSSSASVTSLAMAASLAPKALTLCNPKPPLLSLPSLSSSSLKLQTNLICLTSKGFKSLSSRFVRNVAISSQLEQDEGDFQLFVDNLPFSVDSDQLTELFERAGNIESAEVIYDKASGRSRGSGYVTLSSIDEVEAAAKQFNGYELDGRKLRVSSGSPLARGGRRGGGVGGSESGNQKEVYAIGRYISMSADKARRVIDQIRGRSYAESLMILELMPYRACYPILKLVYSAAANGNHNMGFNEASLIISKAEVNEGKTVKKLRPQARGRGYAVRRRTCHITIGVKDLEAAV